MQNFCYVWDLSGGLPDVLEDSQGNRYVYGLGPSTGSGEHRIARINGSTEEYYVADGLGSTTALTDDTGSVSDTYEYDVFGNIRAETGSSTNEFTYTGEQNESTGLEYLRARYYDPDVGRFISQDPLPLLQRYAYVGSNPANYVDPAGLFPPCPGCGKVKDGFNNITEKAEDFGGAIKDSVIDPAIEFASRFATLNCLGLGINSIGILAMVLNPGAAPTISVGLGLVQAGLIGTNSGAFLASTIINASQIEPKEGLSMDNVLSVTGVATSGGALFTSRLAIIGGAFTPAAYVGVGAATLVSGIQCYRDVF